MVGGSKYEDRACCTDTPHVPFISGVKGCQDSRYEVLGPWAAGSNVVPSVENFLPQGWDRELSGAWCADRQVPVGLGV